MDICETEFYKRSSPKAIFISERAVQGLREGEREESPAEIKTPSPCLRRRASVVIITAVIHEVKDIADEEAEIRRVLATATMGMRLIKAAAFQPRAGLSAARRAWAWRAWVEAKAPVLAEALANACAAVQARDLEALFAADEAWDLALSGEASARSRAAGREALAATRGALYRGLLNELEARPGRGPHLATVMAAHAAHYHLPFVTLPMIYLFVEWNAARADREKEAARSPRLEDFLEGTPGLRGLAREMLLAYHAGSPLREVA